jgi:hypothetical protein
VHFDVDFVAGLEPRSFEQGRIEDQTVGIADARDGLDRASHYVLRCDSLPIPERLAELGDPL